MQSGVYGDTTLRYSHELTLGFDVTNSDSHSLSLSLSLSVYMER